MTSPPPYVADEREAWEMGMAVRQRNVTSTVLRGREVAVAAGHEAAPSG